MRQTRSLPLAQRQAGWSRLQLASLTLDDDEARELLRRAGRRCRGCGGLAKDVHHLWYGTPLGTEPDAALAPLCEDCHRKAHGR